MYHRLFGETWCKYIWSSSAARVRQKQSTFSQNSKILHESRKKLVSVKLTFFVTNVGSMLFEEVVYSQQVGHNTTMFSTLASVQIRMLTVTRTSPCSLEWWTRTHWWKLSYARALYFLQPLEEPLKERTRVDTMATWITFRNRYQPMRPHWEIISWELATLRRFWDFLLPTKWTRRISKILVNFIFSTQLQSNLIITLSIATTMLFLPEIFEDWENMKIFYVGARWHAHEAEAPRSRFDADSYLPVYLLSSRLMYIILGPRRNVRMQLATVATSTLFGRHQSLVTFATRKSWRENVFKDWILIK